MTPTDADRQRAREIALTNFANREEREETIAAAIAAARAEARAQALEDAAAHLDKLYSPHSQGDHVRKLKGIGHGG